MLPKGGEWGLFGMHTVPPEAKHIVVTEGEYDAMAVRQATGYYAVSLPNGCRSLPPELLPWLERFERIYLWLDDDVPGREGAERMAGKLGRGRCYVVRGDTRLGSAKDANEALKKGLDMTAMLRAASPLRHEEVLTFQDVKHEVFQELLDPTCVAGTPFRWLPSLQGILKVKFDCCYAYPFEYHD